jgi:hypothetical protein
MLPFDSKPFPAQSLGSSSFENSKGSHRTSDTAESESKERFVSIGLLFCILGAGLYGEILGYAF